MFLRFMLVVLLGLSQAACYYDAPLVEKNKIAIDPAVLGVWEIKDPEKYNSKRGGRVIIARFSDTEYLIHDTTTRDAMYYRAYPVRFSGLSMVQLQIIASNQVVATGHNTHDMFYVVRYTLKNNELWVQDLNLSVIDDRNLKTTSALKKAFLKNRNHKKLFEPVRIYTRIKRKN